MRAIILAAGEASRWGNYLGVPKHLVPVGGEPVLHRTVRLLREARPGLDIVIVARPEDLDRYLVPGAMTVEADLDPARFDADKFLSSRRYWNWQGETVLLYGDAFYTRDAIATILSTTPDDGFLLFARFGPSAITGAKWAEPFAFRLRGEVHRRFEEAGDELIRQYRTRKLHRIGGWEFYASLTGADLSMPGEFAGHGVWIDDWTEDFDYPQDFDEWARRMVMGGQFHVL